MAGRILFTEQIFGYVPLSLLKKFSLFSGICIMIMHVYDVPVCVEWGHSQDLFFE